MKRSLVFLLLALFCLVCFVPACGGSDDDDNSTTDGDSADGDSADGDESANVETIELCGVTIVDDVCIRENCSYEWESCMGNCECVLLRKCDFDCYACEEDGSCDGSDCRDSCMSAHRTGTAQMADLGECLQNSQACPDSEL